SANAVTTILLLRKRKGNPVKKFLLILFCCLPFSLVSLAQSVSDSLSPRQDTVAVKKDTVVKKAVDSPHVIKPAKKRIDTTQAPVATPPAPVVTATTISQGDSLRPEQAFSVQPYRGFKDALR